MDWGMIFAGGVKEASHEYNTIQTEQRQFNLKQQDDNADMIRKQNFARFNYDLGQKGADAQQERAIETHKAQAETTQGFKMSGMIDKETGKELTNAELAEREDTSGLIPKEERDTQKQIEKEGKVMDARDQRDLDKVAKEYGKDSPEYRQVKDAKMGIKRDKTEGGPSGKEKRKMAKDFMYQAKRTSDDVQESYNVSSEVATLYAINKGLQSATADTMRSLEKEPNVRKAHRLGMIAKGLPSNVTERNLLIQHKNGEYTETKNGKTVKIPLNEFKQAIELYRIENEIPDSKWYIPGD